MERTHFITGATGFVGSALALEILARSSDLIVCLVRPSATDPAQRLRAILCEAAHDYGHEGALAREFDRRCTVVIGDVVERLCGVGAEALPAGSEFWHCAASLKYEDRYADDIYRTNIEGTRQALELALRLDVRAFNHVSTAYVVGTSCGHLLETAVGEVTSNNHYERSKVAAEKLVLDEKRLASRIFRPSIVVGHSRTLAARNFSGVYGFVRNLHKFKNVLERTQPGLATTLALRLRADPVSNLNIIPVDFVAEDALSIANRGTLGIFHLTNSMAPDLRPALSVMYEAFGVCGPHYVTEKTGYTSLEQKLSERLTFYESYFIGDKRFDRRRADSALDRARDSYPSLAFLKDTCSWYRQRLEATLPQTPAWR